MDISESSRFGPPGDITSTLQEAAMSWNHPKNQARVHRRDRGGFAAYLWDLDASLVGLRRSQFDPRTRLLEYGTLVTSSPRSGDVIMAWDFSSCVVVDHVRATATEATEATEATGNSSHRRRRRNRFPPMSVWDIDDMDGHVVLRHVNSWPPQEDLRRNPGFAFSLVLRKGHLDQYNMSPIQSTRSEKCYTPVDPYRTQHRLPPPPPPRPHVSRLRHHRPPSRIHRQRQDQSDRRQDRSDRRQDQSNRRQDQSPSNRVHRSHQDRHQDRRQDRYRRQGQGQRSRSNQRDLNSNGTKALKRATQEQQHQPP